MVRRATTTFCAAKERPKKRDTSPNPVAGNQPAALATVFFCTSLGLAYLATHKPKAGGGVLDAVKTEPAAIPKPIEVPAGTAPAATQAPAEGGAKGDSKAKDVPQ